jgi:hypothetical protein
MACIINASTSAGLVQTADTSGILQLQSNGTTIATINSSGLSVSGGVLQMLQTADAGSTTSSTSLVNVSAASQNITPKSTSSKILIRCTFQAYIAPLAATNVQGSFALYDVTNSVVIGNTYITGPNSGSGGTGAYNSQTVEYFVSNSATTLRQFQLRGLTSNALATFSATNAVWTLTEVAN